MIIPKLKSSSRSREYDNYSASQRAAVVKAYLFDGTAHRIIDENVLGLDKDYSRGYQSMGILHYLGLNDAFKGLFSNMSIEEAIIELSKADQDDYSLIVALLSETELGDDRIIQDIETESSSIYEIHKEGRQTQYLTTRYERDPKNRKQAIELHGTKCMACGFDFNAFYGEWGKDYIEVHHVIPLASRTEEVDINPKTDLIVVCSNCHRMIHRHRNKVLTLEELKLLIKASHMTE